MCLGKNNNTYLKRAKLKLDYFLRHMNIEDLRRERETEVEREREGER